MSVLRQHNYRKYLLFCCDAILWNLSYYFTFCVIYNNFNLAEFNPLFAKGLIVINISFTIIFLCSKVYTKMWRYADIADFFYEWIACLCANIGFFIATRFFSVDFGIRIPIMLLLISTFLLFLFRFVYRVSILMEKRHHLTKTAERRVLIVGAGEAATMLLKELSNNPENEYRPICLVDDDPAKVNRSMYGIPILGKTKDIPMLCRRHRIKTIVFSILTISPKDQKRILDICATTHCEVKMIPSLYQAMAVDAKDINVTATIRDVEVEDLLGREPIALNINKCRSYIKDQVVMVTGGGGSIGSELCRQIANLQPKNLIILDIYENNAYDIEQELKRKYGKALTFETQIASVRDYDKMDLLMREKQVDVVFHAAAHKHVPLMETSPEEAVKNNVFGTYNVIKAADRNRVKRFVQISTDKAVNPTNIMGCTKRICEMMVQQYNKHSDTQFAAVRFGNVLGSNGSVIPLFKQQIKEGGPITVTHPEINRYFMTIPEAVSLVLTAGSMAGGGEIFVLDMGEPVKINDLALNLIRLSGLEPDEDIEIIYTGLRPGEKLYEELLLDEEGIERTTNEKIYIGKPIKILEDSFWAKIDELKDFAWENDQREVEELLTEIVPTFHHNADELRLEEE